MPDAGSDIAGLSVLAVFAHPDDEGFGGGGALAMLVARGVRVTLKSFWTPFITNFDKYCYNVYP